MGGVVAVVLQSNNRRIALGDRRDLIDACGVAAAHNDAGVVPVAVTVTGLERADVEAVLAIVRICHHQVAVCNVHEKRTHQIREEEKMRR
eukprot:COSAG06_NODE_901_length_11650_cov_7.150203_8_plen_90_part_00